jgi:hypothetical protein
MGLRLLSRCCCARSGASALLQQLRSPHRGAGPRRANALLGPRGGGNDAATAANGPRSSARHCTASRVLPRGNALPPAHEQPVQPCGGEAPSYHTPVRGPQQPAGREEGSPVRLTARHRHMEPLVHPAAAWQGRAIAFRPSAVLLGFSGARPLAHPAAFHGGQLAAACSAASCKAAERTERRTHASVRLPRSHSPPARADNSASDPLPWRHLLRQHDRRTPCGERCVKGPWGLGMRAP